MTELSDISETEKIALQLDAVRLMHDGVSPIKAAEMAEHGLAAYRAGQADGSSETSGLGFALAMRQSRALERFFLKSQLTTLRTETIEMCARVAEEHPDVWEGDLGTGARAIRVLEAAEIANSIRALSKTQEVGK